MTDSFSAAARRGLQQRLLRWFDRSRRDLPWRADRDAYKIWISEVMLQQTTVAAVIPYYHRFLKAFPNVQRLAAAKLESVLALWQGLGYYRRAKHLHAAAKAIVELHDGVFPRDAAAAAELPGVGRYILGAVLSQAYDIKLPIVEANSLRVLARLHGYDGDPREGAGARWVWQAAEALLPVKRVGDFNQALMELGSQVCTIRTPACEQCPCKKDCIAFRRGVQESIPPPKRAKEVIEVQESVFVIECDGRYLVWQLGDNAPRWAGMWEFPRVEAGRTLRDAIAVETGPLREWLTIQHTVTRFRITLTVYRAEAANAEVPDRRRWKWCTRKQLAALPMAAPQRKIANHLI